MMMPFQSKVEASHLSRQAHLYVRQSTLHQVVENQESTRRQYALKERAMGLGWRPDQIVVIDSDLGRSAASASDREGFQKLVTDVGLGRAGVVVGLRPLHPTLTVAPLFLGNRENVNPVISKGYGVWDAHMGPKILVHGLRYIA